MSLADSLDLQGESKEDGKKVSNQSSFSGEESLAWELTYALLAKDKAL